MSEKAKPIGIILIERCPQCGTEVQVVVTKKQLKILMKGFKIGIREAQLYTEKKLKIGEGGDTKWIKETKT